MARALCLGMIITRINIFRQFKYIFRLIIYIKAKFVHRAKITAVHSQLAFEGKGNGEWLVPDISPKHKTKNKQKM
jgi:hypothetical protein